MEQTHGIPKIIHYCWLGGGEMPQKIKDCIESWKTVMPDYELMLWSNDTFDIRSVPWVEQACSCGKWAFAADYIRLYALYHYGGIYLDSDVRVLKSFDPFLKHRGFSGIEWAERKFLMREHLYDTGVNIEYAIIGSEKGHSFIKASLDYYTDRDFIVDGSLDQRPIPMVMTPIAEQFGFDSHNYWRHQVLDGDFHIYPYDFFVGQKTPMFDMYVSHNTVAVHLHANSWVDLPFTARKMHSPFTEFRLHFRDFLQKVREDVFVRKEYIKVDGKEFKRLKMGR